MSLKTKIKNSHLYNSNFFQLNLRAYKKIRKRYHDIFPKKIILHNDHIYRRMFQVIGKKVKAGTIIETGTYLGHTTEFLAKSFPNTDIFSCEIDNFVFKRSKKKLRKYPNIKLYRGESTNFIKLILEKKLIKGIPVFFLDAHWYKDWPLEKEVQMIMKELGPCVIVVDDFKVPNYPQFTYDTYEGKECSLERIKSYLNKSKKYNLLFPSYNENDAFRTEDVKDALKGYPILFQNLDKEFKEILKDPFIKKYFKDCTNSIK